MSKDPPAPDDGAGGARTRGRGRLDRRGTEGGRGRAALRRPGPGLIWDAPGENPVRGGRERLPGTPKGPRRPPNRPVPPQVEGPPRPRRGRGGPHGRGEGPYEM